MAIFSSVFVAGLIGIEASFFTTAVAWVLNPVAGYSFSDFNADHVVNT
jgi:hypothetical protein